MPDQQERASARYRVPIGLPLAKAAKGIIERQVAERRGERGKAIAARFDVGSGLGQDATVRLDQRGAQCESNLSC